MGEAKVKMREAKRGVKQGKCGARAGDTENVEDFFRKLRVNSGNARNQTQMSC